ncbi:tRNA (adenosine(37)-N6)-threonylcarbamoyltransferase complex dimerization subunit type 1 TsaB [Gallaecimonas sp. GXIMD4217]|uniref:tRNA (adenosine(37)-N6)-threonylcarbamoyltransferase complex dimerization subunit type 1 TsaB n=1 Tax=Gallaecimonas sp. GXIMD4217 TaxID=3131927 RepID=UPI00311ABFE5
MTTLLALDTATEACSAALLHKGQVLHRHEVCPQQHTRKILPMVDELLAEAGLALGQLDALAYGRGPGSFTGVRIGIGIAQGLAFSAELPLIGVSNLAAMAEQARVEQGASRVLAAIDARMGEVYWGQFEVRDGLMQPVAEELVLPPAEATRQLDDAVPVGTGWAAYPELAERLGVGGEVAITLPSARFMLALAQQAFAKGEMCDALSAEPVYLRDKVTWKKLPGRE